MNTDINCDVAIIGAGIAGLWLAHRLTQQGYHILLIEKDAIGAGQTLRSQGIIHGGTKYALKGRLTDAALSVSQMPALWQACLSGQGEVDLRSVDTLSDTHYLWTRGKLTGAIKGFVSQKMLSSNSQVLSPEQYPAFFQQQSFPGALCALSETVVDVCSLLKTLAQPIQQNILRGKATAQYSTDNQLEYLTIERQDQTARVNAQCYLFTAGQGGQNLLPKQDIQMQLRPLHMVWLRFEAYRPDAQIYVHCVEQGTTPKLTITTHLDHKGRTIWYLGGGLAETGIERDSAQQINTAQSMVQALFPWIDFSHCQWFTDRINRAETLQPNGKRPDGPAAKKLAENAIIAWPTKLALAPLLADHVQKMLPSITPQSSHLAHHWPLAPLGHYLWDQ